MGWSTRGEGRGKGSTPSWLTGRSQPNQAVERTGHTPGVFPCAGVGGVWPAAHRGRSAAREEKEECSTRCLTAFGMSIELADFHHAIREDREPAATGLDGLRVVQGTLAMIASARDGRTVKIEPLTV